MADGRLRDFGQPREYGLVTWCRGEATRWGGDTVMPFAADVAVEFAGVCVVPGDYVFADASGRVVVPAHGLHAVLDTAQQIKADEARAARAIREEEFGGSGEP